MTHAVESNQPARENFRKYSLSLLSAVGLPFAGMVGLQSIHRDAVQPASTGQ